MNLGTFIISLLILLIPMITNDIILLMYLGWSFNKPNYPLEVDDWNRKWCIGFAWFKLVTIILLILSFSKLKIPKEISKSKFISGYLLINLFILPILINTVVLSYMGLSTNEQGITQLDPDDWKRKWLIFFTWMQLILSIVLISILSFMLYGYTLFIFLTSAAV